MSNFFQPMMQPHHAVPPCDEVPHELPESDRGGDGEEKEDGVHAALSSRGYRSGRRSCRETSNARSVGSTNSAGSWRFVESQYETSCCDVPMAFAKADWLPARSTSF